MKQRPQSAVVKKSRPFSAIKTSTKQENNLNLILLPKAYFTKLQEKNENEHVFPKDEKKIEEGQQTKEKKDYTVIDTKPIAYRIAVPNKEETIQNTNKYWMAESDKIGMMYINYEADIFRFEEKKGRPFSAGPQKMTPLSKTMPRMQSQQRFIF